jgi:4-amino-4-deoxy-L-arabinose transferase-like glycosyltransferase
MDGVPMPAPTVADGATHLLPRSLPAYVPLVWKHALFPGRCDGSTKLRRGALALLLVLPGILLYPCLSFRLLEPDEGRYAEVPREMLSRGEWVVPFLHGQPYLDKPPLLYWLVMLSYSALGVHDWAARLVPALAVHATVLGVYWVGRRSVGERAAFWGALFLSIAPAFVGMGRLLILDGLLACCTTWAILAAFEAVRQERLKWGWWLLGAAACGAGILTKGPVAVILLLPPLALYRRLEVPACRIGWCGWLVFAGVLCAINLPWYVAMGVRAPDFLRHFFWEHNVLRFVHPFDHIRPFWFYLPIALAGLLPGTLLLPGLTRYLLTGDPSRARCRSPSFGYYFSAGVWCFLFFSMSGSKLPTYILPALPFLGLVLGVYVAERWAASPRWPTRLAASGIAALLAIHFAAIPWYAQKRSPMGEPERVLKYCGDAKQPIVCFPRSCDSVAFYLKRDDLRTARSKDYFELIQMLRDNPRTVVLLTHRHSLAALRFSLPGDLQIVEVVSFKREKDVGEWFDVLTAETPWGLCDLAVVERTKN